ncbi:MAG: metal-sensitive transcriptional regulator [Alphaproteobacteria bacterium]|nr:metal-sensitive transcriptional regulator [Alphaproteobacteria bacterium]
MDDKIRKSSLARLARIEGQVRGVSRMVEADRYCIDVLTQIGAVRAALDKVEQEILRDHLGHCVAHAMGSGSKAERQRTIDELIAVLDSRKR